ncbi:hypothetical protein [Priestia megaterium]|uniref:hypothetical protein n=1 Tax=Priestia megaterium TaxID=1404 RepID=UPI00112EE63A|nr:hypothetical protein [Priestia megaterium]
MNYKKIIIRILVLLFSLTQPLFTLLVSSNSFNDNGKTEPFIIPAGYTFIIWGIIIVGSVLYGFLQILPSSYKESLYDEISIFSILTFIGFDLWLICAKEQLLALTVLIFIFMGTFLFVIYCKIIDNPQKEFKKRIVYGAFSLYFGWTTVAVFANIAAALSFYGLHVYNLTGVLWQFFILILATITSYKMFKGFHYPVLYFLTILWAFVGIFVNTLGLTSEMLLLNIVVILANIFLLITFIMGKLGGE